MHYQSLTETARQLRAGERSSVELTEHMLERIKLLDASLRCYSLVTSDSALERAANLDKHQCEGGSLGTLHGVPIGVKDLLATAGVVTASGTKVMRDHVPLENATVVARLLEAGAVILGKTQLTEGAYGNHHPDIPVPVNPWNADLWSGVSSSGSGVSVAAGLAFGTLGSDTGGSIRFPSAANHLVGLKPTYGRVSRHGVFPLAPSLDHVGPMTRTVSDAAHVLQVVAGYDFQDENSIEAPVPDYLEAVAEGQRGLGDLTIGVDWRYVSTGVAAEVVRTVTESLDKLVSQGARVVDVEMPRDYRFLVSNWVITCAVECALVHEALYNEHKSLYGPDLKRLIELGRRCGMAQYSALERMRERFRDSLDDLFGQVDLLICPTIPINAPTNQQMHKRTIEGDEAADFLTFTAPFNYSGHPSITLPAGMDDAGRPTSFQLVGGTLTEATLLRAGAAYEQTHATFGYPSL